MNKSAARSRFMIDDEFYYDDSITAFARENYESILTIERSNKKNLNITCMYIRDAENIEKLCNYLETFCRKIDNKIQMITRRQHGYEIQAIDVKKVNINFEDYYNEDFKYSELKQNIESDDNGIIILSGVPGSGKSTLIKYMVRDIGREFCYLPASNIELFSDPSSLPFIIQELNNKILVIEDCEKLLRSREDGDNGNVATILNISDGILGDYLNLKMILTLNITEKIDDALLRKGRLLYSYNFKNLSIDKTNNLAKKLNIDKEFTETLPLTDLLNYSKDNNSANFIKKKKKIGF
jgi:SpoVK/Ycf46/Vps4 family AAA+-type ATPase